MSAIVMVTRGYITGSAAGSTIVVDASPTIIQSVSLDQDSNYVSPGQDVGAAIVDVSDQTGVVASLDTPTITISDDQDMIIIPG